jgi:hypothetical protein
MARNEAWRRSLSGWTEVLDIWFGSATSENILNVSMFSDLRTLYGDPSLEQTLKEHLGGRLRRDPAFLMRMAANVLRFEPPLGWFGRIRVERKGEYRGQLDVKKAGIFAITEGVKTLALEAGAMAGGTRGACTAGDGEGPRPGAGRGPEEKLQLPRGSPPAGPGGGDPGGREPDQPHCPWNTSTAWRKEGFASRWKGGGVSVSETAASGRPGSVIPSCRAGQLYWIKSTPKTNRELTCEIPE